MIGVDKTVFHLALGLLLLFFIGCNKKTEVTISWAFFDLDSSADLTSVKLESCDKWHIVGGKTWSNGIYLQINDQIDVQTNDSIVPKRLNAICLDDKNNLYAVGYTGLFVHNNNSSWSNKPLFDNLQVLRDIAMLNDSTGIAVAGVSYHNGFIFRIGKNQTTTRVDTFSQSLRSIAFINDTSAIVVGHGTILQLQPDGNWERLPYLGDFFMDVHFPTPNIGYIIGNAGSILKSTDGGSHWDYLIKKNTYSKSTAFRALHFLDEQTGFITGEHGLLWKTSDGGQNWTIAAGLPDIEFQDIDVCNEVGVLVGKAGNIISFDPNF